MLSLVLGLPGAYALARFAFRGKRQIALFVLGVRVAPPILGLFPLYIIFSRIDLIGSHTALIVMYSESIELSLSRRTSSRPLSFDTAHFHDFVY